LLNETAGAFDEVQTYVSQAKQIC